MPRQSDNAIHCATGVKFIPWLIANLLQPQIKTPAAGRRNAAGVIRETDREEEKSVSRHSGLGRRRNSPEIYKFLKNALSLAHPCLTQD